MKKRFISGLIFVCLVLGVFAGCGDVEETFAEYKDFTDIISVEDWEKALDDKEITHEINRGMSTPVKLLDEVYIANRGSFRRINPNADDSLYPEIIAFPKIEIKLSLSQNTSSNNTPEFAEPEYVFGANYEENTDIPEEIAKEILKLTGYKTNSSYESKVDKSELTIDLKNIKFCYVQIKTDSSFIENAESNNKEPKLIINFKNNGFSAIRCDIRYASVEYNPTNNYGCLQFLEFINAKQVTATPIRQQYGSFQLGTTNTEDFKFFPNECGYVSYTIYNRNGKIAQIDIDSISKESSHDVFGDLYFSGQELQNMNFVVGNDNDNSTWDILLYHDRLIPNSFSANYHLSTNENATVYFGTAPDTYGKEEYKAKLRPDTSININIDKFLDFTESCDPEKTYLWDHETNRATEVS
jgi:hypothetical protein